MSFDVFRRFPRLSSSGVAEPAPSHTYTLSLHDALPISYGHGGAGVPRVEQRERVHTEALRKRGQEREDRSEEHTSELQSLTNLVCRLLLEKKKTKKWWLPAVSSYAIASFSVPAYAAVTS